jgi:hypothetical protein
MFMWRRLSAGMHIAAITFAITWSVVGAAVAQDDGLPKDQSSWVLGYALVILGIVLGLVAVCRPGNRSADVKIDDE